MRKPGPDNSRGRVLRGYLTFLTTDSITLLQQAEVSNDREVAVGLLGAMPLDDFGLVLLDPLPDHPFLRSLLPTMASEEVQNTWTGSSGMTLLRQSLIFMRGLDAAMAKWRGRSLAGASVLDYGCGWGRLLRLLSHYTEASKIFGVDPWQASIDQCEQHGVWGTIRQSEYLPEALPVDEQVDIAFAFSVFTHTSERAARAALGALRKTVKREGLLIFTARGREFWDFKTENPGTTADTLKKSHEERGFAFNGHGVTHEGEWLYGDASMSQDFARRMLEDTGWRWLGYDRSLADMYQIWIIAEPGQ